MPMEYDPLTFYGRNIIQDYHAGLKARSPVRVEANGSDSSDAEPRFLPEEKVGILGAGIGGLYAALILDSLDIDYEILEASDRIGGRMFTYKFPGGDKYDYYDAGAMRFPFPKKDSRGQYKNGIMKRLAELTEYGPLNNGKHRLRDSLIPYYFEVRDGSKPAYNYFSGIREPVSDAPKGPFGAQDMGIDADYIRAGVDAIVNDVTEPFVRVLAQDIETGQTKGWEVLKANESYSLSAYMANKYLPSAHLELPPQHLPANVINWCGLLLPVTGIALAEIVFLMLKMTKIGGLDFGDTEWKCFDGGSVTLPKKIEQYLNKKGSFVRFNQRVTAISEGHMTVDIPSRCTDYKHPATEEPLGGPFQLVLDEDRIVEDLTEPQRSVEISSITVTVNGNERYNYSHVISTLPLSVLRAVDLKEAGLNAMQMNAVRTLQYNTVLKIAILFKSNWWTTKLGIMGGQTSTDLPIRTVVYPSHGVDSSTPSKVLIASYTGQGDADCLGSLAASQDRSLLRDLVLRNLAEIHGGLHPDVTYAYLNEQFVDMHVQDWNRDEYAMGPFATFGPGQFQHLYTSLTYPAAGKRLHFAGEAVSTNHAWVVGALDSSWRAVYGYLKVTGQHEKIKKFKALWGENSEWASRSPVAKATQEQPGRDLLDEHLGLVDFAVRNNAISQPC